MIYLAGPLFTMAERDFNKKLGQALEDSLNEKIFLPQKECSSLNSPDEIFEACKGGIEKSDIVIAVLDGPDSDSGTCFEVGYAHARGIPIVGIRTDFRQCGDDGGLNLMLSKSCSYICSISSLDSKNGINEIVEQVTKKRYFKT